MKYKTLTCVVVMALFIVPGIGRCLFGADAKAQARQERAGAVPTFQLDPSWPQLPKKWKFGGVTSVAVDAQDHVWVLSRPRALSGDAKANVAPPVVEFDGAGNFVQAWGDRATAMSGRSGTRHPYRLQGPRLDRRQQLSGEEGSGAQASIG